MNTYKCYGGQAEREGGPKLQTQMEAVNVAWT